MKYLDDQFKNAKDQIKEARELKKLFDNPLVQEKIADLYQEYFEYNDVFPEDDWDNDRIGEIDSYYSYDHTITLKGLNVANVIPYEDIINKATNIGYNNELQYDKIWEFKFGKYTIQLKEFYYAEMSEEDLDILEALGKVEVEYISARKESRVFCPN